MQRIARLSNFKRFSKSSTIVNFRGFSAEKMGIPDNFEFQTGPRKQELEAESAGEVAFNDDPIFPPVDAGTYLNPIKVPSEHKSRFVGFENPASHQLNWFELKNNQSTYVPELDLFFQLEHRPSKLKINPQAQVVEAH